MRKISFHNRYHLGDSVFHVQYMRKVCEKHKDIRCYFYTRRGHFKELIPQIGSLEDRIILKPFPNRPEHSINGWAGARRLSGGRKGRIYILNERYKLFYDLVSEDIGIKNPLGNKGMIMDSPAIKEDLKDKIPCDLLVINSKPLSGQYHWNGRHFKEKVIEWQDRYNVVVTRPMKNLDVPCTLDYGLNLLQIGGLAIDAKYVVGIATAPIIHCFNKWNINSVEKWFVLSNRSSYSYNDRIFRKSDIRNVVLP